MSDDVLLRPGSLFFEHADFVPDEEQRFRFDRADLPEGWSRRPAGRTPWTNVRGPHPVPEAGWKVHVAARLDDADTTLDVVAGLCLELGLSFKHMPSRDILHMMERKYAPRTGSGKFITVYAGDASTTDLLLERLDPLLEGREAAVALTDVPVADRPYGVRHGAFTEARIGLGTGLDAYAVRGADGVLRPDRRETRAVLPEGVEVPARVAAALREHHRRQSATVLPFTVTRALHRSNGGGVYDATTADGDRVVLKEGRRHTGLGLDGRDAAASLADESRALRALAGIPGVPRHVSEHQAPGRVFLAMEHMPGLRAIEFVARHHPDMTAGGDPGRRREYAARVKDIVAGLRAVVSRIHARGWSFGDLHPGNVLIAEEDAVSLIDYETASDDPAAAGDRFTVAPGFRLRGLDARAADLVRIDLVHLWLLEPDNAFWEFSDEVLRDRVLGVRHLLPEDVVRRLIGVASAGFADERWGAIRPVDPREDDDALLDDARRTLAEAAGEWGSGAGHAPVDGGPGASWSLGAGMAGVLWALHPSADPRVAAALDRLAREAHGSDRVLPGLFTGRAGVCQVLGAHGRHEDAERLLDRALTEARHVDAPGLGSGLAGIAWAALSAGRFSDAVRLADSSLRAVEAGAAGRGLMDGPSGPVLLAVRLARVTGDERWLDRARTALELDLRHVVHRPDGTVLLDRGNLKHQPDLAHGALGVALAAWRLHGLRPDPLLESFATAAGGTCLDGVWATQGLFDGRLGALAFLAERGSCRTPREDALLAGNLRALRRRLVRSADRVLMPGRLHLRFSHSLGAGLAGAVRVADVLRDRSVPLVPGLDPLTEPIDPCPADRADAHRPLIEKETTS